MKYLITLLLLISSNAFAGLVLEAGTAKQDNVNLFNASIGYEFDTNISINAHYIYGDDELYRDSYTNQPVGKLVYTANQYTYYGLTLGYPLMQLTNTKLIARWKIYGGIEMQDNELVNLYYLTDTTRTETSVEDSKSYIYGKTAIEVGYDLFYLQATYDSEQRVGINFGIQF